MELVAITFHVYQIPLQFVNVFIIRRDDGLILVNTGPAGSKKMIFEAIKQIGSKPSDIKHIIITHARSSHCGDLENMVAETQAQVYTHPNDALLIKEGKAYHFSKKIFNRLSKALAKGPLKKLPVLRNKSVQHITEVRDGDFVPDEKGLQVIHAPGHWDGEIALLYPKNGGILFAADIAENRTHLKLNPRYDNLHQSFATLKRLTAIAFNSAVFTKGEPIMADASDVFKDVFGFR
ncbi:MBL fold metallo-hydrolase [Mucilaginibacter sp. Bleaf8]|uniref:MBL fold metallo-hydrolase n=1 Tax=Mucilaginibacter sp. Bleaf8 TaxID=2834430 RepID=UPI001BCB8078|nr:MBL fold metallo-hydrolase [Mucilaginibacter sp. Bleaf8]MBS7564023.1 MBL fold metallo-hydrolase [Mucilaginibacter sp. Bleaf8]